MTRAELERAYEEVRSEPPCAAVLEWRELCAKREKMADGLVPYLENRPPRCPTCSGTGKLGMYTPNDRKSDIKCPRCNGSGV